MPKATFPCERGCGTTCTDFARRKTRLCVTCSRRANGSHPDKIAKSSAAMKRRMADPALKAYHLGRAHAGLRDRFATDPAFAARAAENARAMGLSRRGHVAQPPGSDARRRAVATRRKTLLGWCPAKYLPEYERLVYSKRLPAAEARRTIEKQVAADLAKMPTHERQLLQIARGAQLTATFVARPVGSPFTLGGVGSSML